jgi:hypothetical protein
VVPNQPADVGVVLDQEDGLFHGCIVGENSGKPAERLRGCRHALAAAFAGLPPGGQERC